MNKKLVALAVAGAFALPLAAQAQSTNVTLAGIVDMGVRFDRTNEGTFTRVESGIESGSRIIFKGTEALGNGLNANFWLETSVKGDLGGFNQGGLGFGRQTWLGFSGGFGEVRLGRQYTPEFQLLANADPFGYGGPGAMNNIYTATTARADNAIDYMSPDMGGFKVEAQYTGAISGAEGTTSATKNVGRNLGLRLQYTQGMIDVGGSFEDVYNGSDHRRHLALAGGFDFKAAKLIVGYMQAKCTDAGCGTMTVDDRNLLLGVTAPLGNGSLYASYNSRDDRTAANKDAYMLAVGYDYNFSKRTNLYAQVARINNKDTSASTLGDAVNGGPAVMAGYDPTALAVGIRHKF